MPDLTDAIKQARAVATAGHVVMMGGADVIAQAIKRGLVDELNLHITPMLLGGGTLLFRPGTRQLYRQREVRPSSNAIHVTYDWRPTESGVHEDRAHLHFVRTRLRIPWLISPDSA